MSDFVWPPRNLPGQAEVWGRAVEGRSNITDARIVQVSQDLNNGMRAMGGQLAVLATQIDTLTGVVNRIPITQSSSETASGFGLSGSYATKLTANITVPQGVTQASIVAIGYLHALDTLTGGVTTSRMRVGISGSYSPDFWAAKDSGATQVLNVLNGTHSRELAVTPETTIPITLQAYGLNGSAFPAGPTNFASLTIIATYSRPN